MIFFCFVLKIMVLTSRDNFKFRHMFMCFLAIELCLLYGDWKVCNHHIYQYRTLCLKRTQKISSNVMNSYSNLKEKEKKVLNIKHEMSSSSNLKSCT